MLLKLIKMMLIVSTLLFASLNGFEAESKIFTFNWPNDFYTDSASIQNGYLPDSCFMYNPSEGYFQFTDTFLSVGSKIFLKEQISLKEDFVLNFKIRISTGKKNFPFPYPGQGLGVIFTTDRQEARYTPHRFTLGIPAFICEIDQYHDALFRYSDGYDMEGDLSRTGYTQHTSFLKDNKYVAINGIHRLQTKDTSVCNNTWICCKIVYKVNSSGAGTIEFWMEEMATGQMVKRNSYNFPHIDSLISGVTDSTNGLVYLGAGSSTCSGSTENPAKQDFKWLSLENRPMSSIDFYVFSSLFIGSLDGMTSGGISTGCGEITNAPLHFVPGTKEYHLNHSEIHCLNDISWSNKLPFIRCDIFDPDRSWEYLNGEGEWDTIPPIVVDNGKRDSLDLDSLMRNFVSGNYIDTFRVRLIAYGDTLEFAVKYYNVDFFYDYFTLNPQGDMELEKYDGYDYHPYSSHSLTLKMSADSLSQRIALPHVEGCEYILSGIDSNLFSSDPAGYPYIDTTNGDLELVFTLSTSDTCGISTAFNLALDCECVRGLDITLGVVCPAADTCSGVIFSDNGYYQDDPKFPYIKPNYKHYFTATSTDGRQIVRFSIQDLTGIGVGGHKYSPSSYQGLPGESITINANNIRCNDSLITSIQKYCVWLEGDDEPCCHEFTFTYKCCCEPQISKREFERDKDITRGDINVLAGFIGGAVPPLDDSVRISLVDSFDVEQFLIFNGWSGNSMNGIPANISHLLPGGYFVKFVAIDTMAILPITLLPSGSLLEYVKFVPNPASNTDFGTLSFKFFQVPISSVNIVIKNSYGVTQQTIYNGIPSLMNYNMSVDIRNLQTGVYSIEFQVGIETFATLFIKL